jgi:hypothetical protein
MGSLIASVAILLVATGCFNPIYKIQNDRTAPGDAARDYIQGNRPILVEIHSMDDAQPNSSSLPNFQSEIQSILGKTLTIQASGGVPSQGASHKYTWAEIDSIEGSVRQHYTDSSQAVAFFLFVDGGSESDSGNALVLGAAYHATSIVIFLGNIRSVAAPANSPLGGIIGTAPSEGDIEQAVMIHEFGHNLGLVNNGIPMVTNHEDSSHPHHSSDQNSVMYWAVESNSVISVFGSNPVPWHFDANDKADVQAARG